MEISHFTKAFRQTLGGLGGTDAGTDAQLLERFIARQDEAAFAALVQRHGPMVYRVCQRMLANDSDVEDAFQATFIVLARRAAAIVKRPSLASWLHGVARRVARDAQRAAGRRRVHEQPLGDGMAAIPSRTAPGPAESDLRTILDEELARLPDKYRAPLVLCYLEGRSVDEATADLGWPRGTVAGRMSRARDLLRKRLTKRGLGLSVVALAALLAESTAGAGVPAATLHALISAGFVSGTGIREGAAILAKEALQAMFWSKLRWGGIFLACLLMLGTATVKWTATGKPAASANTSAGESEDFYVRWRFDNGPPKDIRLLRGGWNFQAGRWDLGARRGQRGGVMIASHADLLLPTQVPTRPFVLTVKVGGGKQLKPKPTAPSVMSTFWVDGSQICGGRGWSGRNPFKDRELKAYFVGRWQVTICANQVAVAQRYQKPYPGQYLWLSLENMPVEEIELRGLRAEDIPPQLQNMEETVKTMPGGPVDLPKELVRPPQ